MSFLDRWLKGRGGKREATRRDGRGDSRAEDYRSADPRDVVAKDEGAMSGPAGTPQEGESVAERRDRDL